MILNYHNQPKLPGACLRNSACACLPSSIYFGHQSVGNNIMDGVKDLMKENPKIKLSIVKTSEQADFKVSIFAHSAIGKNKDPLSKIDSFSGFMKKGIGGKADVASLKFCFVDIHSSTDVKSLFDTYKNKMSLLKIEYPKTPKYNPIHRKDLILQRCL